MWDRGGRKSQLSRPAENTEKLEGGSGGRWQCPVLTESTLLGLSLGAELLIISKFSCLQPSQFPGAGNSIGQGRHRSLSLLSQVHSLCPSFSLPPFNLSLSLLLPLDFLLFLFVSLPSPLCLMLPVITAVLCSHPPLEALSHVLASLHSRETSEI